MYSKLSLHKKIQWQQNTCSEAKNWFLCFLYIHSPFSAYHILSQDTHRRSPLSSGRDNFAYLCRNLRSDNACAAGFINIHLVCRFPFSLFVPLYTCLGVVCVCVYQMSLWHERKLTKLVRYSRPSGAFTSLFHAFHGLFSVYCRVGDAWRLKRLEQALTLGWIPVHMSTGFQFSQMKMAFLLQQKNSYCTVLSHVLLTSIR